MISNPLLQKAALLRYDKILPKHYRPAITALIKKNRSVVKKLLAQKKLSWDNFIEPLEEVNERLMFTWSAMCHMNSVMGVAEVRRAYRGCLAALSKYIAEMANDSRVYEAYVSIAQGAEYERLNPIQKRIIQLELRDFWLSGVTLPAKEKKRVVALKQKLAYLGNKFLYNVLDARQIGTLHLTEDQLMSLVNCASKSGKISVCHKSADGYLYSLEHPSYTELISFTDSRVLREKIYKSFSTSISGAVPSCCDNTKIIEEMLAVRHELARILSFNSYAEYSLSTKMAKNPQNVEEFLQKMISRVLPYARKEADRLEEIARDYGIKKLKAWDVAYFEEKLQKEKSDISNEDLRPYFPVSQVLRGMFEVVRRLFGITVKERKDVPVWHKTVRFFDVYDEQKKLRGQFYADLYSRSNKRDGAWVEECQLRRRLKNGKIQPPIAYLVCNFAQMLSNRPSLITHAEATILFHEFGHCLLHILSNTEYAAVCGMKGVPWDMVEFVSQFMENWCWQPEVLALITKHYKTKKSLPKEMVDAIIKSRKSNFALFTLQQLEYALIDFRLHLSFNPSKTFSLKKELDKISKKVNILPRIRDTSIAHSFTHVFSGEYAANYYSYKWAEVLSADAFSKFEKNGIFDKKTGRDFFHNILEVGGQEDIVVSFEKFLGRRPQIDALFKYYDF